jgi:hypothetical protein
MTKFKTKPISIRRCLTFVILHSSFVLSQAADTIDVVSPSLVQRNGVNVGNVASFVATNPQFASEVQAGLERWASDLQAASASAVQDASAKRAAAEQQLKALIGGAKQAAQKKTAAERNAAMSAAMTEIEKTEKQKRREAVAAEKAKLDTEAAALSK